MADQTGFKRLDAKLAVVTGATSGVGLYTALGLARLGAGLVITGRDVRRLSDAASWIKNKVPGAMIEIENADFAKLPEVRAMAERIAQGHEKIEILVNNAGLIMPARSLTADGFETTFQVNHLAPFLLTALLLPSLRAAAPARIVNVSSRMARYGKIDFGDLNNANRYRPWIAYSRSKLANIMFTYALARRLAGTGVTANAVHPGFVASNFGRKGPVSAFIWALARPIQISPARGASNSLYAAAAPEMDGVSGKYLANKKSVVSHPQSRDIEAVEHLWRVSAEMTGVPR